MLKYELVMEMLTIKKLSVVADNKEILSNFNLDINEGETHCIMGPNGVGKSTICRAILKDPNYLVTKGTIKYKDKDLKDLSTTEISRLGIMMIAQNPTAIEGVTNAEMLRLALSEKTNSKACPTPASKGINLSAEFSVALAEAFSSPFQFAL